MQARIMVKPEAKIRSGYASDVIRECSDHSSIICIPTLTDYYNKPNSCNSVSSNRASGSNPGAGIP